MMSCSTGGGGRLCPAAAARCSFVQLETDEGVLKAKATDAVERYGVHGVVANLLQRREVEVHFLEGGKKIWKMIQSDEKGSLNENIANMFADFHGEFQAAS
jgi:hypothetical protein